MDTLTLKTTQNADNAFMVAWQWRQSGARQPVTGEVDVAVDPSHKEDRASLAELRAIYYLLEDRQIHGDKRLGNGVKIEVSAGAIRKALLKGALKTTGVGKTQKVHIAAGVDFLATKYFEAEIDVGKWREATEPKSFERASVVLEAAFPRPLLRCDLLDSDVMVSRHAMSRYVARIDQGLTRYTEDDLSAVPDVRWSAAWRWFERVLCNSNMEIAKIVPQARKRFESKYGASVQYLRFPDAKTVLVLRKDKGCLVLSTVMRDDTYTGFLEKDPYIVGQKIVKGHIHERTKAERN